MKRLRSVFSAEVTIAVAVLSCFLIIGWLDFARTSRIAQSYDTYSSYDYRPGGYRAWFELLRREGVRVDRYTRRPAFLNEAVGTLIVANNDFDTMVRWQAGQLAGKYSTGDLDRLRRWVEGGGHLVWLADQASAMDVSVSPLVRQPSDEHALRFPTIVDTKKAQGAIVPLLPSPIADGAIVCRS